MRHPLRPFLALGLVLAAQAVSAQSGPVLAVPLCYQEHSNWCWAAAAQMVLVYRGLPYAQCAIVNQAKGIGNACDGPGDFTWSDPANGGLPMTDVSQVLNTFGVGASIVAGHLEPAQVMDLLQAGDPVIIGWKWKKADRSHSAVITGFVDDGRSGLVFINDPWPGWGASSRTWDATVAAPDRDWAVTCVTN